MLEMLESSGSESARLQVFKGLSPIYRDRTRPARKLLRRVMVKVAACRLECFGAIIVAPATHQKIQAVTADSTAPRPN